MNCPVCTTPVERPVTKHLLIHDEDEMRNTLARITILNQNKWDLLKEWLNGELIKWEVVKNDETIALTISTISVILDRMERMEKNMG